MYLSVCVCVCVCVPRYSHWLVQSIFCGLSTLPSCVTITSLGGGGTVLWCAVSPWTLLANSTKGDNRPMLCSSVLAQNYRLTAYLAGQMCLAMLVCTSGWLVSSPIRWGLFLFFRLFWGGSTDRLQGAAHVSSRHPAFC